MSDAAETTVCPECGNTRIRRRCGGIATETDHDWHCRNCAADFDAPVRRAVQSNGGISNDTLAAKLVAADPDEVSAP